MRLFVIDTKEKLKKKLEMVQTLGDIEIATRLLEGIKETNDIDANYGKLKCEISPINKDVFLLKAKMNRARSIR